MVDSQSRRLAGRYELRGLIGRGGMAEVRLGYDLRLSRVVAIKMLRTDLARDPIFQERFRREAQSAASLNHPAIVAVYDTGEELLSTPDGSNVSVPYIVMEYVEGHTVRDLLANGQPVMLDEAVEIVAGVLSALEYSHHEGLVHRDIKPGNIMLTNTGKVKVMDFGIARALEDSQATMTQTDAVVGTAQYLSPEQAQGETVDARSDLYSTGCVLFELLTGRPPFRGDSAVAVAYQHVSEPPPVPSSIASDIPGSLDQVVLRSLAKRRQDRYSSAAEMRADLMHAAKGGEIAPVPPTAFLSTQRQSPDAATTTTLPPMPPKPANATQVVPPVPGPPTSVVPPVNSHVGPPTGVNQQVDPPQKSKNGWLVAMLVILSLVLVGGGIAYLLWPGSGAGIGTTEPTATEDVRVPDDLIGKTQAEARKLLDEAGLKVRIAPDRDHSDKVPADAVLATEPASQAMVPKGSTVTLTLSAGPKATALGNYAGQDQADALAALKAGGFKVSVKTVDDPEVEKGRVIGTEPAAGTELKSGDAVQLLVASGYVKIPSDLIGEPVSDVSNELSKLGLSVTTQKVEDDSRDPDTVVGLNPMGTAPIHSNVTVSYIVHPAAPPAPVTPTVETPPQPEQPPANPDEKEPETGKTPAPKPKN
ncbi:hypothetical protein BK816_00090 [Boudabousia tangfeifanii]|uniref:non-specific serine/threonine protein kinase n=1 Tax=Boudabousia tangfeifanii TaxID=1912795 RepID=A0A1D9MHV6_9ACTO|nr:Stk1 family PASTA domain-containing Ser/Thr kinase [Boudabousia tangfeifanii]AOZ71882.1 hypothetical protein BK816_00090 [Boudabousia tangfeifanii]